MSQVIKVLLMSLKCHCCAVHDDIKSNCWICTGPGLHRRGRVMQEPGMPTCCRNVGVMDW